MQTILGAGGAIGSELAKALVKYTTEIRLVSRNPQKVNETDTLFKANLLNEEEVMNAVADSAIVYVTAGLEYNRKVWKSQWPVLISNVIKACIAHQTKLVFFDNMYMYDKDSLGRMTEENPVNPPSVKGKVRAQVNKMIFNEVKKGTLTALIARCADYYGPGPINTSMLWQTVVNPIKNGKTANWLGSVKYKHSFTYTPDAGQATALLGNTPDAYNQVWHLPTAPDPPTGKEWIESIAAEFGVKPKYSAAPKFMVRIIGLFIPIMREMVEMTYQFETDYVFDSSKFEKRFNFKPTSYREGIKVLTETNR